MSLLEAKHNIAHGERDARFTGLAFFPSNLAPEEVALFTHMNEAMFTDVAILSSLMSRYLASGILPNPKETSLNGGFVNEICKIEDWQLQRVIRLAPVLHLGEILLSGVDDELKRGVVTLNDKNTLERLLTVEPLELSRESINVEAGVTSLTSTEKFPYLLGSGFSSTYTGVQKEFEACDLTPAAKQWALEKLTQHKNMLDSYERAISHLGKYNATLYHSPKTPEITFLTNWAESKTPHKDLAFTSVEDEESFAQILSKGFGRLIVNKSQHLMDESEIAAALKACVARIKLRDVQIEKEKEAAVRQREAAAAREAEHLKRGEEIAAAAEKFREEQLKAQETARTREHEQALNRAEQRRVKREDFLSSPRPYALNAGSRKIMEAMQALSATSGYMGLKARLFAETVERVLEAGDKKILLDVRNDSAQELGNLLLSPASLGRVAKAFTLQGSLPPSAVSADEPLNERAKKLRRLYSTSNDVRDKVNALLDDEMGTLLVAQHTLSPEACAKYASYLADSRKGIETLNTTIAGLEKNLSVWTPEELTEFANEIPDLKKLNRALEEKKTIEDELKTEQNAFIANIRQVFDGLPPRRISSRQSGEGPVVLTQVEQSVPSNWLPIINGEHILVASERKGHVGVHHISDPTKIIDVDPTIKPELLRKKLEMLAIDRNQHEANTELMLALNREAGFSEKDSKFVHAAYEIEVPLRAAETDISKGLVDAQSKFEQKHFAQESALRSLAMHPGVKVEKTTTKTGEKGPIRLFLLGKRTLTLAISGGYFDNDDFAIAEGERRRLAGTYTKDEKGENGGDPGHVDWVSRILTRDWKPQKNESVIVCDANVLQNLCAKRSNGKEESTWLDLLATSRHKIVIPEVVLLEMTGRIPSKGNSHSRLVDKSFEAEGTQKAKDAANFRRFIENHACHGALKEDGAIDLTGDTDRTVIVMSTPGDVALYQRADKAINSGVTLLEAGVFGNNEGENAITRIVKALPHARVGVATDDKIYIYGDAPKHTEDGRPVPYGGTGVLIDELLHGRPYNQISRKLRSTPSVQTAFADILSEGRGAINRGSDVQYVPVHDVGATNNGKKVMFADVMRGNAHAAVSGPAGDAEDQKHTPWVEETGAQQTNIGRATRNRSGNSQRL